MDMNHLVYIDIYYVDDRPPLRVLCNTVDVCPNNTCRINGGLLDGTTIYNACGAEVVRESIKIKV